MLTEREKRDRELLALLSLLGGHGIDRNRIDSVWDRLAPASYRGLTAAYDKTSSAHAFKFWWDPASAQFGYMTRGLIPPEAIRAALNIFNAGHGAELATLTAAAARNLIPASQWESAMRQAVVDAQLVNAAVGRGGSQALTDDDLIRVSGVMRFQFERLGRFSSMVHDVARRVEVRGKRPATPGEAQADAIAVKISESRADAYARSAISTYDNMRRRAADVAGFTLERNILGVAEHCKPDPKRPHLPDCPGLTNRGWQPLGTITPIGQRLCLWNCHCHMKFGR